MVGCSSSTYASTSSNDVMNLICGLPLQSNRDYIWIWIIIKSQLSSFWVSFCLFLLLHWISSQTFMIGCCSPFLSSNPSNNKIQPAWSHWTATYYYETPYLVKMVHYALNIHTAAAFIIDIISVSFLWVTVKNCVIFHKLLSWKAANHWNVFRHFVGYFEIVWRSFYYNTIISVFVCWSVYWK